jgi:DUF1680 family protein
MKHLLHRIIWAIVLVASALDTKAQTVFHDYPIQPVPFNTVHLSDRFWAPRLKINQEVTIPIALEQCYSTGRVDNFKKAAGRMSGYFGTEYTFDDTDIYKIIEGMSYSVANRPNAFVSARMDTLIEWIGAAQEADGYIYTARTAGNPEKMHPWVGATRWEKDPEASHELYCCGHLFEAAAAHFQATGKRTLLNIALKNADLLVRDFGPGKLSYEPGHQIVEMGLVRLYRVTGNAAYLKLAQFFLDLRGHGKSGTYSQTHLPVIEQKEAVGHAVRAMYMYSGMADVAALTGNKAYVKAIDTLWNNVVTQKLYLTGGIGASSNGEAFGANYELPNRTAYCETCAAIGNVYWNYRLFLLHGDARYFDVLERSLYNGVLSGVSLSGDRFFYPNPLESTGSYARSKWFGCACCPSNMCRFMPSVPGYIYAQANDSIYVNLFVQSTTTVTVANHQIQLSQHTDYPWDGKIDIDVRSERKGRFTLLLRVPGWARNHPVPGNLYRNLEERPAVNTLSVRLNGRVLSCRINAKGYLCLAGPWQPENRVQLEFPMTPQRIVANEKVLADTGKIALQRGPLVYCLEGNDNEGTALQCVLNGHHPVTAQFHPELLGGCATLTVEGENRHQKKTLTAIPYFAWANRGKGEMAVWIPSR